jgi:hypothetical protein
MSILWLVLGTFIGWHFPQPLWAKMLQAKVVESVKTAFSKPKE